MAKTDACARQVKALVRALRRGGGAGLAASALLVLEGGLAAGALAAEVEEVLVTSNRLEETIPLELARYGNRVEVISAEEIRERGFVDVTQTLQMLVPGLHIRPKNGSFDYFDASLQGSRGSEILWLIDGVRITNRLYNGTSPLDTVPAHMIERIEVLKGGQGIFYGTQSVGGVVNVVTRSLQNAADGAVGAGLNSNGGRSLNAYWRGGRGSHQLVAYASHDEADGYQPFRDRDAQPSATDRKRGYEVDMLGLKYAWNLSDAARLSLQYQRSENELDWARPFLVRKEVNQREEDIFTAKLDWQLNDSLGFFVKAYQHNWDTEYSRVYNRLDEQGRVTGEARVVNAAEYWGYEDYGLNAMAKFTPAGGLEYVLGYDHQNFSGYDEVWRIGKQEEEVDAVFAQVRSSEELFENSMLALGLRHNEPSNSRASTVWNLSGRHDFSERLFVTANVGTSFRLPDAESLFLNELYDDDADGVPDGFFSVGNPDLKPERSRNRNVSVGGLLGEVSWELIGFDRRISDYIAAYVPWTIAGVEGESFINTADTVKVRGWELIAVLPVSADLSLQASYNRTRARLNDAGPQLVGIPEAELKLRADYQPQGQPFGLSLALNKVGDLTERRNQERGGYSLLDLSGFYNFGRDGNQQLVLRVENLTDREYATRVEVGTLDSGGSYLYDNLGMERTFHASYRFSF